MFGKVKRYSIAIYLQKDTDIYRTMCNGKSAKDALQYYISVTDELKGLKIKKFDTTKPFHAVVSEIKESSKYTDEQIDAFVVVKEEKFTLI